MGSIIGSMAYAEGYSADSIKEIALSAINWDLLFSNQSLSSRCFRG